MITLKNSNRATQFVIDSIEWIVSLTVDDKDNLRFEVQCKSEKILNVEMYLAFVSYYPFYEDWRMIDNSFIFQRNTVKGFNTEVTCAELSDLKEAYFKDDNLRVKLKLTVIKDLTNG